MNDQTAKAGFKTFIITLSVSLALFGVLYYLISSSTTPKADIENEVTSNELASTTSGETVTNKDQKAAVFQELSKTTPANVLGAAAESTQGTTSVPVTGSTEITIALLLSLAILGYGGLNYLRGPRKLAISKFEKDLTRDL